MTTLTLGDKIKNFEKVFTEFIKLDSNKPIVARLDGRSFSSFTRDLQKPFDLRFTNFMIATSEFLMDNLEVDIAYSQSDEITLLFKENCNFYDGRVQKISSVVAGLATAYFNKYLSTFLEEKQKSYPVFDCRVFNVPDKREAINCLVWRHRDAIRNSVSMVAHENFSNNEIFKKTTSDKLEMLSKKGIDWNNHFHDKVKTGTFIKRIKVLRKFTEYELSLLPENHNARKDKNLEFERSELKQFHIKENEQFHSNPYIIEYLNT